MRVILCVGDRNELRWSPSGPPLVLASGKSVRAQQRPPGGRKGNDSRDVAHDDDDDDDDDDDGDDSGGELNGNEQQVETD